MRLDEQFLLAISGWLELLRLLGKLILTCKMALLPLLIYLVNRFRQTSTMASMARRVVFRLFGARLREAPGHDIFLGIFFIGKQIFLEIETTIFHAVKISAFLR